MSRFSTPFQIKVDGLVHPCSVQRGRPHILQPEPCEWGSTFVGGCGLGIWGRMPQHQNHKHHKIAKLPNPVGKPVTPPSYQSMVQARWFGADRQPATCPTCASAHAISVVRVFQGLCRCSCAGRLHCGIPLRIKLARNTQHVLLVRLPTKWGGGSRKIGYSGSALITPHTTNFFFFAWPRVLASMQWNTIRKSTDNSLQSQ